MKLQIKLMASVAMAAFLFSCESNYEYDSPTAPMQEAQSGRVSINVLLNAKLTNQQRAELKKIGSVHHEYEEINAVTMLMDSGNINALTALDFVKDYSFDAIREGAPLDMVLTDNFEDGRQMWNLDAVNVMDQGVRTVNESGRGVYVAVLDTGLPDSWRTYFPEERIISQYATSFTGGGAMNIGNAAEQPNKWEHDQNGHGGHVTSTIIGFNFRGTAINGVAPMANIIPVKVLNQNGSGWSSAIAEGLIYVANLKKNTLNDSPVIINMSLGGSSLDVVEKAALDYAISNGVIIAASAGNSGNQGMGYPGAYQPVISVAASGWEAQLGGSSNIRAALFGDTEENNVSQYFITSFSSRAKSGQDLDVVAPGNAIVGPYQLNSGTNKQTYYFLSGTSMASPHVAGILALMAEKNNALTPAQAESIMESVAIPMPAWPTNATGNGLILADMALGAL